MARGTPSKEMPEAKDTGRRRIIKHMKHLAKFHGDGGAAVKIGTDVTDHEPSPRALFLDVINDMAVEVEASLCRDVYPQVRAIASADQHWAPAWSDLLASQHYATLRASLLAWAEYWGLEPTRWRNESPWLLDCALVLLWKWLEAEQEQEKTEKKVGRPKGFTVRYRMEDGLAECDAGVASSFQEPGDEGLIDEEGSGAPRTIRSRRPLELLVLGHVLQTRHWLDDADTDDAAKVEDLVGDRSMESIEETLRMTAKGIGLVRVRYVETSR